MKSLPKILLLIALTSFFAGCGTVEEYVLLNDLDVDSYYKMQPMRELRIKRGDNLRIVVSHKLPQLIEMFNPKVNTIDNGEIMTTYTVNEKGYINFPYFDTIHLEGMTCSEAERYLSDQIDKEGIAHGATVNIKITNFKVTVIGESGTGIYEFDDDKATIFDLVAKANLVSSYNALNGGGVGIRRDKILVMREINGIINSEYISLLSKDIFYSPYFYLQQGDVFYVWPSQTSIRNSNKIVDFWINRISLVTSAVSIVTLFVALFKK